ncbi:cobyrinic Acid a,c-diamide synthase [Treponema primitia ZAS-2]|uniref:Cobyrinate a,c-diamide synthase n=1 Tax=Treponema primitia (strain ATCC BAA-887 / DSM 12427 / ZAS-2) TaxID=545694 RepID=F5YR18_TREPZ|nr:cobyrinate a,c-diamide synthase [Treponema primitia]AEF86464.1 cobyrinic Acid a,c-diamide synthase [Treponema primitia ZAS-2]
MSPNSPPALIVSATHSGAGKTTITRALLAALKARGLIVQPFKIGPDFIDPMYHTKVVGRPSVNLDVWMMGEEGIRDVYARWTADVDVAVIEGMGALYDGADGGNSGSAAHLAAILGVPVLVVVDVWGMTRTTGAIMDGMDGFDPAVQISGFVLNRIGSSYHRDLIEKAIGGTRWRKVVATIEADRALEVPERHLGLLTTWENSSSSDNSGIDRIARQIDIDRVFSEQLGPLHRPPASPHINRSNGAHLRLALAQDAAFCFYYEENLAALAAAGFDIIEFSPAAGEALPPSVDAVYFGGGYPESFAPELAANKGLADQLRQFAESGMPIYGECGGLIYLGRTLRTFDGMEHKMSGVLPIDFVMDPGHLSIRYAELTTCTHSLLGPEGTVVRGQEFHQSRVAASSIQANFFTAKTSDGQKFTDGYQYNNVTASYTHIYFGGTNTTIADNFFESAALLQHRL